MKKAIIITVAVFIGLVAAVAYGLGPGGGPLGGGAMGTVNSVGLSMPSEFSVSGSPVTVSGTIAVTEANQNANTCYCGPTSGGAAAPGYRSLGDADVPNNITIDLAATATALAANPTDCASNQFATAIAANGNLTCGAIGDADVPNNITIDLATAASALAADPSDCASNQFATNIAASGNLTCAAITDAMVPDTITASNYLPLAGGTMAGAIVGVGGLQESAATTAPVISSTISSGATANAYQDTLSLVNSTAATSGNQQFSPSLHLKGQGYYATGTGSEAQEWRLQVEPVQSAGAAGTTTSNLTFRQATAGGSYGSRMTLSSAGLVTASNLTVGAGTVTCTDLVTGGPQVATTDNGVKGFYQNATLHAEGGSADGSTGVGFSWYTNNALVTEGSRIHTWANNNRTTIRAQIDKNGAYANGYVSTTTTNAGTSTVTLVSAVDDDSLYHVNVRCLGNQVAATPGFYAAYNIDQYVTRIDGTIAEGGETALSSYESAVGCDCTLGVTDAVTDLVTATVTGCDAAAGTMQWKIYMTLEKVSGTAFTGVAQPAAN